MEPNGIFALVLWLGLFFAIKIGFIGMAILIQHAKADFIERASDHYRKKPNRLMFLLGLANGIIIPFIGLLLMNTQILGLVGVILILFYLWLALLSYTVVYKDLGSRLFDEFEGNRELKTTLYGGAVAEAAFFVPVLGQLYSILLFVRSLGAVTLAFLTRKSALDVVEPVVD
jgi:hypothetical protein